MYESLRSLGSQIRYVTRRKCFHTQISYAPLWLIETKCQQSWEPFLSQNKAEGMKPIFVIDKIYLYLKGEYEEVWSIEGGKQRRQYVLVRQLNCHRLLGVKTSLSEVFETRLRYLGQTTERKSEKLTVFFLFCFCFTCQCCFVNYYNKMALSTTNYFVIPCFYWPLVTKW